MEIINIQENETTESFLARMSSEQLVGELVLAVRTFEKEYADEPLAAIICLSDEAKKRGINTKAVFDYCKHNPSVQRTHGASLPLLNNQSPAAP